MILCRMIAPAWAPHLTRVKEGLFTQEQIAEHNTQSYNIYYFPNYPSKYNKRKSITGADIDNFEYVFIDMDTKDGVYNTKEEFIETIINSNVPFSKVVDSGNGIHVYWRVTDLDPKSYLRFERRLMRLFKTDAAVGTLMQLMRLPGTLNTKVEGNPVPCVLLAEDDEVSYTSEELDKLLPQILKEDEDHVQNHYNMVYKIEGEKKYVIADKMPQAWGKLLSENTEAGELFRGSGNDRSKDDFRLGHLMFASGFTKDEAMTVLVNTAKASTRSSHHRISYAENIVDKIWTYELADDKEKLDLSMSVKDILRQKPNSKTGQRLACHKRIDNTEYGFRRGQVIGLVAGSGVGKTAFTLNMFKWFAENNPQLHHFFVSLEQPGAEIADRWVSICGDQEYLHEKVHVLSNYDEDGNFRNLSFDQIRAYIEKFKKVKGVDVGCVVIDHIGAIKKVGKKEENQDIMAICHAMKGFAVQTNTLLVMQSQTSREKAGIGDLPLDKDAAYGTTTFEWYCDFLITMWQPLKRCHEQQACPTVTAFKFCKIRNKKPRVDVIQEDVPYYLYFESDTGKLMDMTQDLTKSFAFFIGQATKLRTADKKSQILEYKSVPYEQQAATHE